MVGCWARGVAADLGIGGGVRVVLVGAWSRRSGGVSSSTVNGPKVGIAPKLSDSELLTLAVMQAMLSFSNETQWLRYAKNHLTTLPVSAGPTRIQQATARRSVDAQGSHPVPGRADGHVHRRCVGGRLDPVECGRSTQTAKRSDLAGWAGYGYCASHSRYFWGLRLHLVCTLAGVPITFALTHPKDDEREVLMGMFQVEPALVAQRPRQTVIGDKNYFGREFEDRLRDARIRLLRPARKGETERPGSLLFKPYARSSSRSTKPSRANSTSNTTVDAPSRASRSASYSASSR